MVVPHTSIISGSEVFTMVLCLLCSPCYTGVWIKTVQKVINAATMKNTDNFQYTKEAITCNHQINVSHCLMNGTQTALHVLRYAKKASLGMKQRWTVKIMTMLICGPVTLKNYSKQLGNLGWQFLHTRLHFECYFIISTIITWAQV